MFQNVKKMSRGSTNTGGGIPVKGLPLRAGGTLNWSSASTGSSSNVHPDQNKLDRNVALCAAESLIPLEQLTKPCFNRLIGDLDGHVSVSDWLLHVRAIQYSVKHYHDIRLRAVATVELGSCSCKSFAVFL